MSTSCMILAIYFSIYTYFEPFPGITCLKDSKAGKHSEEHLENMIRHLCRCPSSESRQHKKKPRSAPVSCFFLCIRLGLSENKHENQIQIGPPQNRNLTTVCELLSFSARGLNNVADLVVRGLHVDPAERMAIGPNFRIRGMRKMPTTLAHVSSPLL